MSSRVPFWKRTSTELVGAAPVVPVVSIRMGVSPLLGIEAMAPSSSLCSRADRKPLEVLLKAVTMAPIDRKPPPVMVPFLRVSSPV